MRATSQVNHFMSTVASSESDVYLFAGITGDLSPNHVNEEGMKQSHYRGCIAYGTLPVGYMSACSTMAFERFRGWNSKIAVSLGYDRVRFLQGVRIGETITVHYEVASIDQNSLRSRRCKGHHVRGLAVVAQHIPTWVNAKTWRCVERSPRPQLNNHRLDT